MWIPDTRPIERARNFALREDRACHLRAPSLGDSAPDGSVPLHRLGSRREEKRRG
jgi:hypothetical protein